MQKPGKALLGWKVENTIVPLPWTIPKHPEFTTQRLNTECLKAQAKYYKALTQAEKNTLEDDDQDTALPFTDVKENRVYLVRCLNIGILQALKLYNDAEEGVDIHYTKTMELPQANTLALRKKPIRVSIGKQTKYTNLQRLAEEAAKGKPELPFEEIVPKEYWSYRKAFKG